MEDGHVVKDLDERTFFKKCPKCGKRFEVRHTSETVEKKQTLIPEEKTYLEPAGVAAAYPIPQPPIRAEAEVEEDIEEDTYTETYRCVRCGNTWTETREKVRDIGGVGGTKGDA